MYQFRIFTEIISDNNDYLLGFGLNASTEKIKDILRKPVDCTVQVAIHQATDRLVAQ